MSSIIRTERLDLVPMSKEFLRASLEKNLALAETLLSASIHDPWPDDALDVVALRLEQLDECPALQSWLLRAMVLRESGLMVGHIGFHTAPDPEYLQAHSPGAVEFGFEVFPQYRRRAYAREACNGLMNWARAHHGQTKFVLSISPNNAASHALAARLGFARIGSHIDEVDGVEDIMELNVAA